MIQYSDAIISYLFTLPGTKAVRIFFSAIIKNLRSFIVFFSLIVRKDEGAGDNELIRAFIAGDM